MPEPLAAPAIGTAALADRARTAGRLGIDTEFMSEGRYRPLLALVQVAVAEPEDPSASHVEVLDPLEGFDHRPLAEVLADPGVEVVMHAGRQDVAILRREWETEVRGLFDTQVAAGFAGLGAQMSYAALLAEVCGVRLEKSASFTRWDVRPLTGEQVAYARDDVTHLLQLCGALQERLDRLGRLDWAREECRRLEAAGDERDPGVVYLRLPRGGQLRPRARAVARELAAWRERTAAREDKPVGTVLSDPVLVEVAKRQPESLRALEQIRGVQRSTMRRRGDDILAAVARGREAEPIPAPPEEKLSHDAGDAPLIAMCEALVRHRVQEAGLAYELVASRADLTQLVRSVRRAATEPQVRALQGWRRELVGEELLELLAGRRMLRVVEGAVRVSDEPAGA